MFLKIYEKIWCPINLKGREALKIFLNIKLSNLDETILWTVNCCCYSFISWQNPCCGPRRPGVHKVMPHVMIFCSHCCCSLTQFLKDGHLGTIRKWVPISWPPALALSSAITGSPALHSAFDIKNVWGMSPCTSLSPFLGGSWVMPLFLEVIAAAVIMSTAPPILVSFLHSTLILIT